MDPARRAVIRRRLLEWAEGDLDARLGHGPPALGAAMRSFMAGYRAALSAPRGLLDDPFAVEGAGMALAGLDALDRRAPSALAPALGDSPAHDLLLAVGAGCAHARLRRPDATRGLPPALEGAARDGAGFFAGLFRWAGVVAWADVDRDRDRGVGRSLWFTTGAAPGAIVERIAALPMARRSAVWRGVGLASTFTGGRDAAALAPLRAADDAFEDGAAQGRALRHAFTHPPDPVRPTASARYHPTPDLGGAHETP